MSDLIYTVGHSTHPIEEFTALLNSYEITQLIDIRTIPKSRKNPQFAQDALAGSLREERISYRHLPDLGGLRRPAKDSVNGGWRNSSFRGYADYMQTAGFAAAVDELIKLAANAATAIMCAEAVPWRCHRSLVADALLVRGVEVIDIFSATNSKPAHLTGWARVNGQQITYPPAAPDQLALGE